MALQQPAEVVPKTETGVASKKQGEGGFECEFVEKPPSVLQTECPICLQILREPYQVICCGKSYCRVCIGRIKTKHQRCPTCKKGKIQYFPNKGLQQPLYQQKVRCTHQKEGCEWTGELGALDNHLNLDPQRANQLEGCSYTLIGCQYSFAGCTAQLARKDMPGHLQENTQRHFTLLEAKYNAVSENLESVKANIHCQFPTPPVTLTMTNYEYCSQEKKQWTSPPFYTALRGYKMCLKVDVGLCTPLSVQLYMMRGEFDTDLTWNNQFTSRQVNIEVVSQVSWEPNKSVSITPHSPWRMTNTSGFSTDESQSLIQPEDMYMYVRNDSVQFCISSIGILRH